MSQAILRFIVYDGFDILEVCMEIRTLRRIFRLLNRFFMVPAFRLGLGVLMGTPFSGYILVMKMKGWKSAKTRYVPVNYAIKNGNIYCLSGFGKQAHWYRNLMAGPDIELLLPGRNITAHVEDETERPDALDILRQVLKNSGFASFMAGINPFRISDEKLAEFAAEYRLLSLRPTGVLPSMADPGGKLWLLWIVLLIGLIWLALS